MDKLGIKLNNNYMNISNVMIAKKKNDRKQASLYLCNQRKAYSDHVA